MKLKSLFIGMCLLIGTFSSFAGVNVIKANVIKANKKTETTKKPEFKNIRTWVPTSCTVRVTYGNANVAITYTCTCTQSEACDKAYAVAKAGAALFNK